MPRPHRSALPTFTFILVSGLLPWFGERAEAQSGVRVDLEGVGTATSVRALDGETIPFRRYAQRVGLRADQPLGDRDGPRLLVEGRLRIATDFGPTGTTRARVDRPSDLYTDNTVEVMAVRLEAVGERANVTLGRQLRVDALGFSHFDGATLDYRAPSGLSASTFVGAQVTEGWLGINSADFDLDGVERESRAFGEPVLVQGGEVGFESRTLRLRLGGRQGYRLTGGPTPLEGFEPQTPGDRMQTEQRLGGALHARPHERIELDGDVIYNVALGTLDRTSAEVVGHLPWAEGWVGGGVETWRPSFRLDSVFNVFGASPFGRYRLRGGGRWPVALGSVSVESGAHWARYGDGDLSATLPGVGSGEDAVGGDVRATLRWTRALRAWVPTFDVWLHLRAEAGHGGELYAARLGGRVELLNQQTWLWTSMQAAWFGHELQPFRSGPLAGGLAGASWVASRWGVLSGFVEVTSTADYVYALALFGRYQLDFDLLE